MGIVLHMGIVPHLGGEFLAMWQYGYFATLGWQN